MMGRSKSIACEQSSWRSVASAMLQQLFHPHVSPTMNDPAIRHGHGESGHRTVNGLVWGKSSPRMFHRMSHDTWSFPTENAGFSRHVKPPVRDDQMTRISRRRARTWRTSIASRRGPKRNPEGFKAQIVLFGVPKLGVPQQLDGLENMENHENPKQTWSITRGTPILSIFEWWTWRVSWTIGSSNGDDWDDFFRSDHPVFSMMMQWWRPDEHRMILSKNQVHHFQSIQQSSFPTITFSPLDHCLQSTPLWVQVHWDSFSENHKYP